MKTIIQCIMALVMVLTTSPEVLAQWGKRVKGNGNVTTRTVNTGSYDEIKVVGSMDVHLERGSEGAIRVKTDDNLQEYVIVEVSGNSLKIKTKKNYYLKTKNGIHVYVPFEDLDEISLTGSGDIDTDDAIRSDQLEVSVTGSGDVDLDIDTSDLEARVTGSGDIVLKGRASSLEIVVSGSGDFDGDDLEADNTEVTVTGSGDASVVANRSLKARVSGSGTVVYSGNPSQKDTKTTGSGTIKSN